MAQMKQCMAVHHNPGIDCKAVQANWRKLAKVENAKWLRTYFNDENGWRYCIWLAPDDKELQKIFGQMGISYESIQPVEETVPDLWGEKWEEHLQKDETAATRGN